MSGPTKQSSSLSGAFALRAPVPAQFHVAALWLTAAAALFLFAHPALALLAGIAFALLLGNPVPKQTARVSKYLLQASVVGLGFGIPLGTVLSAGATGLGITALSLVFTLTAGWLLARWLGVDAITGALISAGTAICGGSAIAVMGPVLGAEEKQMSVALLAVFLLNAAALLLFPLIGSWAGMDQAAFGTWAAMSIHDTSSVAGAAAHYGAGALGVAVAVKLARALWILPMAAGTALLLKRPGKHCVPWFVLGFLAASAATSFLPGVETYAGRLTLAAKAGLALTLFLVGAALSRDALRSIGWRPLIHAIVLWVAVSLVSFGLVQSFGGTPETQLAKSSASP